VEAENADLRVEHLLSEWSGLKDFLEEFVKDLPPALVRFIQAYVGGQMTVLRRKSIPHLATVTGVSAASLRKMLRDRRWNDETLRSLLWSHVQRVHGKRLRGVIFEHTLHKSGAEIPEGALPYPAIERRAAGAIRLTNLGLADRGFCCILGSDPFHSSGGLKDNRQTAPAGDSWHPAGHPRWKGAFELVDRAMRDGIRFDWLLLDRRCGAEIALLQSLSELGQRFIAEVPESLRGWLYHPLVASAHLAPAETLQSPTESPTLPVRPPRSIKELTSGLRAFPKGGGDAATVHDPQQLWEARILTFYAEASGLPTDPLGLLVLRDPSSGYPRHFLSNGFLGVSLKTLTEIALSKDKIEGNCRQVADQVGLGDFQLRNHSALRRHLALSSLSMLFRAELSATLEKTKSPKGSA